MTGRYEPLTRWLEELDDSPVATRFSELEELVGALPRSARTSRTWWGNTPRGHASSWLDAGWIVSTVDLEQQIVSFAIGERTVRGRFGRAPILDGKACLESMIERAGWPSLSSAVAAHTVFLDPRTVAQTEGRALFPIARDPTRRGKLGTLEDGRRVMFDDNTTPTDAFLWAADRVKGPDVQFNHVWNRSADPDSYTALWNLCCTPAFLAKTSDTHPDVVALLRYRAYDLYGVRPDGVDEPRKPASYDQLSWMPHPPALDALEGTMRKRMASAQRRPATLAARSIGWLFSDGPDPSV